MEKDFEPQFKKLSETINLSKNEKDFHRSEIIKFMEPRLSPYTPKTIASPFNFLFKNHFIMTPLVIILVFSTSLSISAESSLPNSYLYQVKTKVTEPVQVFLTTNPKAKAQLKVALVEKRLQEFSQVTLTDILETKEKDLFIKQLSFQVKDAHKEIEHLIEVDRNSEALETTNNLQSVLSAQDTIFKKIPAEDSEEEASKDEIANVVDDSIKTTNTIENKITEDIQTENNTTKTGQAIDDQKRGIATSLENIEKIKQDSLQNPKNLDLVDEKNINYKISGIKLEIEKADKKLNEGDKEQALLLLNQINQDLGELEVLLHAEKTTDVPAN